MSYAEESSGKTEVTIMTAETSMISLLPDFICCGIILLILFKIGVTLAGTGSSEVSFVNAVSVIVIAIILGIRILQVKMLELTLTNKKLYGITGVINTKVMDSPLNKVDNITVKQGFLGKIFNYGKIVAATSSGRYIFNYIKDPDDFRSAVMSQIDKYNEDRICRQSK